ncbi:hypothetical protein IMY05_001G0263200 [Salix suchowensis]|nr:hypothetical protein IMY05_001G0263200 [Salix suchowensis]
MGLRLFEGVNIFCYSNRATCMDHPGFVWYQCSSRDNKKKTNNPDKKTPGKSYSATNDPTREGLHEAKQQALEPDESTGADTDKRRG